MTKAPSSFLDDIESWGCLLSTQTAVFMPAFVEELTGLSSVSQRQWRTRAGFAKREHGEGKSHQGFSLYELAKLLVGLELHDLGMLVKDTAMFSGVGALSVVHHLINSVDSSVELVGTKDSLIKLEVSFYEFGYAEALIAEHIGAPDGLDRADLPQWNFLYRLADADWDFCFDIEEKFGRFTSMSCVDLTAIAEMMGDMMDKPFIRVTAVEADSADYFAVPTSYERRKKIEQLCVTAFAERLMERDSATIN